MRILVVDDEAPARKRLLRMLGSVPHVEVVGEASTGALAVAAVRAQRPDLMLLDIQMPELDGMSLVSRGLGAPLVIFVTAHDQHAVAAFEVDAVDYLLKPVRQERLMQALERARQRLEQTPRASEAPADASPTPHVVTFERGATRLFDARSLTRFWASDKYTVFIGDGEERLTAEPLSALARRLAPHGFARVHRAEVVRLSAVRALRSAAGVLQIELEDGQVARVSRRSIATLRAQLRL
jgi:DNA-binding LytR/AlgR family response regulator